MTTEQQGATPEPAAPEAVVAQPQEAAPAAPAAAELAKTAAWVDGIRQKANRATAEADAEARGDEEGEDEEGGEEPAAAAAADGKEAKPEAEAEAKPEEEGEKKPRRALADLHADHRARLAEKKSEKLQQRLDAIVAVFEGLQAGQPAEAATPGAEDPAKPPAATEAAPKAEDDPEPEYDLDPKNWHAWRERQFERRWAEREESLQRSLLEQLNPLIEGGKLQQQQVQQQAQVQAEQQRSVAIAREVATLVDEYKETNEGQGYGARVDAYARYFIGDLMARGATEEQARAAFQDEALDLLLRGENEGHHPVAYYDAYLIHKARLAQGLPGTIQSTATAEPAPATSAPAEAKAEPAPAKPQKTPQQKRAETDLAAAAAAAKLPEAAAGGDRDAVSAGPQEFDIGKMVQRGKVTSEMMERIAKAQGLPLMKVIRAGMRAATGG